MKIVLIVAVLTAGVAVSSPGSCRSSQLGDKVQDIHISAPNALSALVQFGRQTGICLGVEVTDVAMLNTPVSFDMESGTLGAVVHNVLPQKPYDVRMADSVLLVRGAPPKDRSQLDTVVPEYKIADLTVPEASLALSWRLKRIFDPAIQGFAGHISIRHGEDRVLPIDEHGRTAREILTMIVDRSRGGAWVAGPCPVTDLQESSRTCWSMIEYRDAPEEVASTLNTFALDLRPRLEHSDRPPERP